MEFFYNMSKIWIAAAVIWFAFIGYVIWDSERKGDDE